MTQVLYKPVDPRGRNTISGELRKKLDLSNGDIVRLEEVDGKPEYRWYHWTDCIISLLHWLLSFSLDYE